MKNAFRFLGVIALVAIIGFSMAACETPDSGNTAVTFVSLTANGSATQTTTELTLTFNKAIEGLTASDITWSGVSGVRLLGISSSNPYTLQIGGFTSGGTLSVGVSKSGYDISGSPTTAVIYYCIDASFRQVSENSSSTQPTTQLTLTFDKAIEGLTADDITLSGVSGVTKGTLSGSNPYTLPISGFTSGGTLSVEFIKSGYYISRPWTLVIYGAFTFENVTADGSPEQPTTELTLTFDNAVEGLTADDITLSGVTKGTLSGSNPYTLPISGFTGRANISVTVSKWGYKIRNNQKSVVIYNYTTATFNDVIANGSSAEPTTELTLTFDKAFDWLTAADITLSGVYGVTKGTLSGSNPYALPISGFTSSGTLKVNVSKEGYNINDSEKEVYIYRSATLKSVTANGSATQTTTQLTLTFNVAIQGLTANDITLSGVSGVTKGTLSGSNPYTLPISGFTSGGTLTVAVSKSGYDISDSEKTVNIFRSVTFSSVTANGSTTQTTTQLTLTFNAAIEGLTADDIALSGGPSVTKGALSGSNPYTLSISDVTSSGTLGVAVSKPGCNISGSPKTVLIYYYYFNLDVKMVKIPAGTFTMGSPASETGRYDDETQHSVTLSEFYMGIYEVTREQYAAVTGKYPSSNNKPYMDDVITKRPVEKVSWYDALVFCNMLSMKEGLSPAYSINGSTDPSNWGSVPTNSNATWNAVEIVAGSKGYRLPTEAQWEYACRAGTTTAYNTGSDSFTYDTGWYNNNSLDTTHEVGKKNPNTWGLYDMHGNVFEWCWDWYGNYGAQSSGTRRVIRGGYYNGTGRQMRSAYRSSHVPGTGESFIGFRLVRPSQ